MLTPLVVFYPPYRIGGGPAQETEVTRVHSPRSSIARPGVHPGEVDQTEAGSGSSRRAGSPSSTSANPTSTSRAPSPRGRAPAPGGILEFQVEGKHPRTRPLPVVVYCTGGVRLSFRGPRHMGGPRLRRRWQSLVGGFQQVEGRRRSPWAAPENPDPQASATATSGTYLLPEVGETGQLKLLGSQGAAAGRRWSGLARAALYLAAAGVGTLGVDRHGRGGRVEPAAPRSCTTWIDIGERKVNFGQGG